MRLRLGALIISLGLGLLGVPPAQAQISDGQVEALVEALRQAAPQTGTENDGLYSDWQVKSAIIPRWSEQCIGRELTPEQFEASPSTARTIIVCVVEDVLQNQYRASDNNEALAVRRAASWWMTGDPTRYNSGTTEAYTQKVLGFYQQQNQSTTTTATTSSEAQTTLYDRYMRAGYEATKEGDYQTALLYFKRALDERPDDSYAEGAIRNVESYLEKRNETDSSASSQSQSASTNSREQVVSASPTTAITQQQAVELVTKWLQAKQDIFAPPFDEELVNGLTTGELQASLIESDGVIDWLRNNQAYYRFGVQKLEDVERLVANKSRAKIELKVTEDRTLYRNNRVDPNQTDFETKLIRYSLESVDDTWKISDYKAVDGSLLERAVLNTAASSNNE